MRSLRCRPGQFATIIAAAIFTLLLLIAGCVISPRRVVNEAPSPTPTPDISPTPTPTATPTPTPTGMDKTVPRVTGEFLFLGDANAPLITGFRINGDGSLAPVPGSPFAISAPAQGLAVIQDTLVIADKRGIISYQVNRDTGTLQQTDAGISSLADVDRTSSANMRPQLAVLDATGRFMYVADVNRGELAIYQTNNGRLLALSKSTIPISNATISIAIVKP